MAHTKAGGSTSLGRDSQSKRLGIKKGEGQFARAGSILVRQRGTRYHPGQNVDRASDDSLFARSDGYVHFHRKHRRGYDGILKPTTFIHVMPERSAPKAA